MNRQETHKKSKETNGTCTPDEISAAEERGARKERRWLIGVGIGAAALFLQFLHWLLDLISATK